VLLLHSCKIKYIYIYIYKYSDTVWFLMFSHTFLLFHFVVLQSTTIAKLLFCCTVCEYAFSHFQEKITYLLNRCYRGGRDQLNRWLLIHLSLKSSKHKSTQIFSDKNTRYSIQKNYTTVSSNASHVQCLICQQTWPDNEYCNCLQLT